MLLCPAPHCAGDGAQANICRDRRRPLAQLLPGSHNLPRRSQEAVKRLVLLCLAGQWQSAGKTLTAFCQEHRFSHPTLWRWAKRFQRDGLAGLFPQTHHCGRKPANPARRAIAPRTRARWIATASRALRMSARDLVKTSKEICRFASLPGLTRQTYLRRKTKNQMKQKP